MVDYSSEREEFAEAVGKISKASSRIPLKYEASAWLFSKELPKRECFSLSSFTSC